MESFPSLLSIRKFNKKGELYPKKHILKSINENHLVLFGAFPFDCDKKHIMMNCVCDKYPDINWVYDKNGKLKKENYDACDSLVCALAYINTKRYGEINPEIVSVQEKENNEIEYVVKVWDKFYTKSIIVNE